jgi:hypothetical protein
LNTQQIKQAVRIGNVLTAASSVGIHISKVITAWAIIGAALFSVARPWVEPWTELPQSVDTIKQNVGEVRKEVSSLRTKQVELSNQLKGLVPVIVAEFDEFRSRIVPAECERDTMCIAELWVRRTEEGKTCGVPILRRFIRDAEGTIRAASNPRRTDRFLFLGQIGQ